MRLIKILLAVLTLQLATSCSKPKDELSLAGNWKITSAVGNDDRHWTGSFTLKQKSISDYTGLFLWDSVDGLSTGTDSVTGTYNLETKVLTMKSIVISGNIELVTYTANVTDKGKKMDGIWTGSSDGSIKDPGRWTAEKQ